MGAPPQLPGGTTEALDYQLEDDGFYDEAFEASGSPRPSYERLIGALAELDLGELATAVSGEVESWA